MPAREPSLRLALLSLYALILAFCFRTWYFAPDDGLALSTCCGTGSGWILTGAPSSVFLPHLPFVYYYYLLFWKLTHSVTGIQAGIAALLLAAHWLLIEAGLRISRPWVAYGASLLAFSFPGSFLFFQQRFWEPAALPFFLVASYRANRKFRLTRQTKWLALTLAGILFAESCHQACLVFLFVVLLELFEPGTRTRDWALWAGALLVSAAPALPMISGTYKGPVAWLGIAPLALSLAPFPLLGLARRPALVNRYACGVMLAAAVVGIVGGFRPPPLTIFANVLATTGSFAPIPAGFELFGTSVLGAGLVLLVLGFFSYLAFRRAGLSNEQQDLLRWILFPGAFLMLAILKSGVYGQGWATVLLPLFWLGLALSAETLLGRWPAAAVSLVAALVLFQAWQSWSLERQLLARQGSEWHLPTLEVKQEVAAAIGESTGTAAVVLMEIPYPGGSYNVSRWRVGEQGWAFLLDQHIGTRRAESLEKAKNIFYLYQTSGTDWAPSLREELFKKYGTIPERNFGSAGFFHGDRYVEGVGTRIY